MGTDCRIALLADESADRLAALATAERRVRELESRLTRFLDTSELSRLNAAGPGWHEVSAELGEILTLAMSLHEATGRIYDPTIIGALERAGYDRSFELVADSAAPCGPQPKRAVSFTEVEVTRGRARLPAGVRLDLGGLAKGWAADVVADDLAAFGPAIVDLGGDLALRGTPPEGGPWVVGVARPGSLGEHVAMLRLDGGGVATSGTDRRRWRRGATEMHHLIDPRTAEPARSDVVQAVALHARTAHADAWAKVAVIAGSAASAHLAAAQPDLEFALVLADGTVIGTPNLASRAVDEEAKDGTYAATA